ncbi:sporulation protein YpjB [Fredinandcohnia sp. QZ13]|uniref:sporulation protein YpjB n=1 Tax=Fredinandcohnia sp. QZ13 TaxID=3073144 RepID=UPI002853293C|nr:sporulation protein YpjB [Fredinandcohnia sp. QZ13]MDR4888697.1 sporulation protein YpjB [Fredinandcohnia sp. QZ13]
MKISRIICIICFIVMIHPISINATSTEENWDKLDQISDQALQMVKQERYKDAKQLLTHFSNEFLRMNQRDPSFSMDELRIITLTHESAFEAVTSSSLSMEERVNRVTQFRLVVDAMRSEYQPMWTELEDSIMTTFGEMKETIEEGDKETFNQLLTIFLSKYNMIHPSITVDITPQDVQKIESHIAFLDAYRNEDLKTATRIQQLEQMELDLKKMFDRMTEDDADPSLIWVMISTGGAIILTLIYVGWRKYKGDKQKRQKQRDYEDR